MQNNAQTPVEVINVEFEGFAAVDSDVPAMSKLLNQMVRESGVSSQELAKVLVSQNYVGCVLKTAEEDDDSEDEDMTDDPVYALTSMINLRSRQEPVIKDIFGYLRKSIRVDKLKAEKGTKIFDQIIDESGLPENMNLGLLVKERMINMPVEVVTQMLTGTLKECENASQKGMQYDFNHVMYWSRVYLRDGNFQHYDVEDSVFDKISIDYFTYPLKYADTVMVETERNEPGAPLFRRVYICEAKDISKISDYASEISKDCKKVLGTTATS